MMGIRTHRTHPAVSGGTAGQPGATIEHELACMRAGHPLAHVGTGVVQIVRFTTSTHSPRTDHNNTMNHAHHAWLTTVRPRQTCHTARLSTEDIDRNTYATHMLTYPTQHWSWGDSLVRPGCCHHHMPGHAVPMHAKHESAEPTAILNFFTNGMSTYV